MKLKIVGLMLLAMICAVGIVQAGIEMGFAFVPFSRAAELPTQRGPLVIAPAVTCVERFPGLPRTAEKLGISPGDHGGGVMLDMCSGAHYDLFSLIDAFLDTLDAEKGAR